MSQFELNKGDQFIILLDDSGSMAATDTPSGQSRYQAVMEQLDTFMAEADQWDPDGVSFYLFSHDVRGHANLHAGDYKSKIPAKPTGSGTCTDKAVRAAYAEHKKGKAAAADPSNYQTFAFLFTDGAPDNGQALKSAIVEITKDVQDEKEFRIAFLTVGKRDAALNTFLTDLDDNLVAKDGAKYDIVDVKELKDVDFRAAVEGALND